MARNPPCPSMIYIYIYIFEDLTYFTRVGSNFSYLMHHHTAEHIWKKPKMKKTINPIGTIIVLAGIFCLSGADVPSGKLVGIFSLKLQDRSWC